VLFWDYYYFLPLDIIISLSLTAGAERGQQYYYFIIIIIFD